MTKRQKRRAAEDANWVAQETLIDYVKRVLRDVPIRYGDLDQRFAMKNLDAARQRLIASRADMVIAGCRGSAWSKL